jgi:hypothetical protein
MRKPTIMALGAAAVLSVTGTVFADVDLPYADTFDSITLGGDYTQAGGPGTITADATEPLPGGGANSLCISNTTLNLAITSGKYSNVWIQVYAKPVTGSADPTVTGVSGAFFVKETTGMVRVWNGTAWADSTAVTPDTWVGFLVHVDYSGAGAWDLYANDGTFLADANKIASNLALGVAIPNLVEFSVQSGDAGYIDALALGVGGETVTGASPGSVAVTTFSNTNIYEFVLPVYAGAWTSSRKLDGAVGTALISGLTARDEVQFAGNGLALWDVYNVSIPAKRFFIKEGAAPLPSNKDVFENTKILVDLAYNRSPAVTYGFFPYDTGSYLAEDGASQGPAVGQSIDLIVNGKGVAAGQNQNVGGWTGTKWNDATLIRNLPFNDDELVHGDKCFIASPGNPNAFAEYWYNEDPNRTVDGSVGIWMSNNNDADGTSVPAGSKIWLQRQTDDSGQTVQYVR